MQDGGPAAAGATFRGNQASLPLNPPPHPAGESAGPSLSAAPTPPSGPATRTRRHPTVVRLRGRDWIDNPTLQKMGRPAAPGNGWSPPGKRGQTHTLLAQKAPGVVTVIQDCSFLLGRGKVDLSVKPLTVLKHERALRKQSAAVTKPSQPENTPNERGLTDSAARPRVFCARGQAHHRVACCAPHPTDKTTMRPVSPVPRGTATCGNHSVRTSGTAAIRNRLLTTALRGRLQTLSPALRRLQTLTAALRGHLQTLTTALRRLQTLTSPLRRLQTLTTALRCLQTLTSALRRLQTLTTALRRLQTLTTALRGASSDPDCCPEGAAPDPDHHPEASPDPDHSPEASPDPDLCPEASPDPDPCPEASPDPDRCPEEGVSRP
ncbi:hypothetical protein E5288_WYG017869 [Bos mutus]|uniref:Uncharacterized protein n=1 Tax=Bos mutus TaxID=72004 RepID=A0A6B0S392_9CETA|nr:hypothetical protein [Bos mutus]